MLALGGTLLLKSLLVKIAGTIVWTLFAALIVQLICGLLFGFKPEYLTAFLATLFGNLAALIASFILGIVLAIMMVPVFIAIPLILIVCFIIQANLYGRMLEDPGYGSIGIAKGALVSLLLTVLVGIFYLIAATLMMGSGAPV